MRKKLLKRSTCAVLTAALTTAGLALPPKTTQISAADTVLKYEFEDGSVSGGKIYMDRQYSGGRFRRGNGSHQLLGKRFLLP